MGYCMHMSDSQFVIKANMKSSAFEAVKELDAHGNKSGGSWGNGRQLSAHFAWVDENFIAQCSNIEDVLDHWRYPVVTDGNGDIVSIEFHGEKLGDEGQLWEVIAPFVEDGSYLEMNGEDGFCWRWIFQNGTVREITPTVTWPTDHAPSNRFTP